MSYAIAVEHTFETAHRLPHIPGKCQSLHGHSWHVRIEVAAPARDSRGMVVEFGPFKKLVRHWIDEHLDHGLMLGHADPLLLTLDASDYEGKLYVFTDAAGSWPTVENVASVIATLASGALAQVDHANNAWVSRVDVRETSVNGASWIGPGA